jgi:hypothetical protein
MHVLKRVPTAGHSARLGILISKVILIVTFKIVHDVLTDY